MEPTQIPWVEVFGGVMAALWMLSEALASIPALKANSVFQLVAAFLQKFKKPDA